VKSDSVDLAQANRILNGHIGVAEILAYLDSERYMTKRDAAHGYSGLGELKLGQLIKTGKLRAFRIGKKTLIRKSDLDAVILAHEITPEIQKQDKNDLQKLTARAIEQARARVQK
jgi:excisionase family DNA binding protein